MRTLLIAVLLLPALAHAQSTACHDAEVVLVGRAAQPVMFRVSGEAAIEEARQNVIRVEEAVSRERAGLDPRTRLERDIALEVRRIKAQDELDRRQAMYPPPYDLRLFPLEVEDGIRGVSQSTVMLLDQHLPAPLEPGESYLIIGHRRDGLVPPLPAMSHLDYLNSAVEAERVIPVKLAQQEVAFLTATKSGATILGTLRNHTWGDGMAAPISGVRILISSSGREVETVTQKDGSFAAFGIPPGRVEIKPVLPPHLAIFNRSALIREVRAGACTQVVLTAAVNGRVRGRVISVSNRSLKDATIHLSSIDMTRFRLDPTLHYASSHAPRLNVNVGDDGTFEFFGVPAGTYLLIATVPKLVDGKEIRVTTYYPGSSEQSGATPLEVGEATEHEGFDFVVRSE